MPLDEHGEGPHEHEQRIRVDVYHHFPEGIPVEVSVDAVALALSGSLTVIVQEEAPPPPPTPQAVTGRLSVQNQGDPMGQLTVDSAGNAIYKFDDDHGDIVAPPQGDGSGLVVTFASDTPSVASFADPVGVQGTDDAGNVQFAAPLTFGVDGSFSLSADVENTSAAPLVDDDGTTAFVQAQPVVIPVAGGQATTGSVSEG